MKKVSIVLLFTMITVLGVFTGNPFSNDWLQGNLAYAANEVIITRHSSQDLGSEDAEKFKAEFSYEMAQITAKIVTASVVSIENFKMEVSYAIAQATAKVMSRLPTGKQNNFAYDMALFTSKIINDPNPDIEKSKKEFVYKISQLTASILTNTNTSQSVSSDTKNNVIKESKNTLLRNNADIEHKVQKKNQKTSILQEANNPEMIDLNTYNALIGEITQPATNSAQADNKLNINGEIRYHYAWNRGDDAWKRNTSGIRTYLGFDFGAYEDWRVHGRLENRFNILNYDNDFDLSRLYLTGTLGVAKLQAGSFGYLMADGNIYDSGFDGIRADFGGRPLTYTVSLGKTKTEKDVAIGTVRYEDYDYDLEAGFYHYRTADNRQNSINTLGANYHFSNFSLGAMLLNSSLEDAKGNNNGYVFTLKYGEAKSWRPGTYGIFAKYYNQPQYTYINHGMNGIANWMQGFKGYSLGINYTFTENVVGGMEYYHLTEKNSGKGGNTWWSNVHYYF